MPAWIQWVLIPTFAILGTIGIEQLVRCDLRRRNREWETKTGRYKHWTPEP